MKAFANNLRKIMDLKNLTGEKLGEMIGQRVWEKNKELLLLEIAGWCIKETTFAHYDESIKYINKAEFMPFVSSWDMS